jgi:type III secretory pathway component EscU
VAWFNLLRIGSSGGLLRTQWIFGSNKRQGICWKSELLASQVWLCLMELSYFSGIGASMATTQSEYLLRKYFSSRLPVVHTLYQVGQAVGEMLMPILIGSLLTKFGLSSTLLLQAGITLQALTGAVLFRKPRYKHATQNNMAYTLLQVCTSMHCQFIHYLTTLSIKTI